MINIQNGITNRQIVFILYLSLTAITLITLPKDMAINSGRGFWVTILISSVIFGFAAVLITKLNMMFPGDTLYDYSRRIIGKAPTYAVSVFYILYFLTVSFFLCISFANVMHFDFFTETPRWGELIVGIPLFGYMAYKGTATIARLYLILGGLLLVIMTFIFVSMLFEGRIERVLPLFVPSEAGKYITAVKNTITPFLGMELLTVIPFTKKNKGAPKAAFFTILGIGLYYILSIAGCHMMLGSNEIVYHNDALIEAIRLVQYPTVEFLQRLDIFYLTFGFMGVSIVKSLVYTAVVEYFCRMFPKVKRIYPVIGIGVIIFVLSELSKDVRDLEAVLSGVISVAGLAAAAAIPGLLYIIARVKRHAGKVF